MTRNGARREGAYRFIESDLVDNDQVGGAMFAASAHRLAAAPTVIVAVDQSTVSFVDREGQKGLGRIGGTPNSKRLGFEVMSALAVSPDGQSVGLLAQKWHLRPAELTPRSRDDKRPIGERESGLWHLCISNAMKVLEEHAPLVRPWFQLDRGGDIGHVLAHACQLNADFTIRASWDRRLETGGYMRRAVRKGRCLGFADVTVPFKSRATGPVKYRKARLSLRTRRLAIRLQDTHGKRKGALEVTVVHAREVTRGVRPRIEWFLLTNRDVTGFEAAVEVVGAYRYRWRIEEFHRAWKSGVCDVQSSQLRSVTALRRWATILAAVATRAERLKTASRTNPNAPATSELTRGEIDAAILLSRTKRFAVGDELTLQQAVALIAELGGYTGKSSGGPPGATVISRGLHDVMVAARAIEISRKM